MSDKIKMNREKNKFQSKDSFNRTSTSVQLNLRGEMSFTSAHRVQHGTYRFSVAHAAGIPEQGIPMSLKRNVSH